MPADQLGDTVVRLVPNLVRSNRPQLVPRRFDRQIQLSPMPELENASAAALEPPAQKRRNPLDRIDRRRKANALQPAGGGDRLQPLQRQSQVRAALVAGRRMDLIDDHRPRGPQRLAAALGGQQNEQRLRRGHQDVRRALDHPPPLPCLRIAGAHRRSDCGQANAAPRGQRGDLGQRPGEILLDVVAQRLQRRNVHHARSVRQISASRQADESIETDQKRRQGLARAGRSGEQNVPAGANFRPAGLLGFGRTLEAAGKPLGDERVEIAQRHRGSLSLARAAAPSPAAALPLFRN